MPLMPRTETDSDKVWELLMRDIEMDVPGDDLVKVYGVSAGDRVRSRFFQTFEVAMVVALEKAHPDYDWKVTPKGSDGGLDFIGEQYFFDDSRFGINAAIKVCGQCKKRTAVKTVLDEVGSDIIKMVQFNPTFFVVALSADVCSKRIKKARGDIEKALQRHCYILDRPQVEMLLGDHLGEVKRVLKRVLGPDDLEFVVSYLENRADTTRVRITPEPVHSVLAGVPFRLEFHANGVGVADPATRFWWREDGELEAGSVRLLSPPGADTPGGAALTDVTASDDPLHARVTLELETFTVGRVSLGELVVDPEREPTRLGEVEVVENVRPPFYDKPFRPALVRLRQKYDRVTAGGIESVVVVGAGGSGKSRLCEEFSREKRQLGSQVVTAQHAHTPNEPHELLRGLFYGLVIDPLPFESPGDSVVSAISGYDRELAERAAPAIRALFPSKHRDPIAPTSEDAMIAALDLLVAIRTRHAPLIVHLQDLHWAGSDTLFRFERLLWELREMLAKLPPSPGGRRHGVLFLFEGREREHLPGPGGYSKAKEFDDFVARNRRDRLRCPSFGESDRRAFVRLLFENKLSRDRRLPEAFIGPQDELIENVDAKAGGNPFHSIQQVQLLKEREVIAQNSRTGLVYMIRPVPEDLEIPESVLELIKVRWHYLRDAMPDVALLIWACALLDARVPAPLYRALKGAFAPGAERSDIEGTDILWSDAPGGDLVFRHENYFDAFHRELELDADDLRRVVEVYCSWFASLPRPSPGDRLSWARALLKHPTPDTSRAQSLLNEALRSARRQGDQPLARRIAVVRLDLIWCLHDRRPLPTRKFIRHCDEEIDLTRELLSSDRSLVGQRMQALIRRIEARLARTDRSTNQARDDLERRRLGAEVVYDILLFNAGDPGYAAEVVARTVAAIRSYRAAHPVEEREWDEIEMEALYCQSCARALSGDGDGALEASEQAATIARHSTSMLARKVISTHANILLSTDLAAGETLLRDLRGLHDHTSDAYLVMVHLTRALVLRAHRLGADEGETKLTLLREAARQADQAFRGCFRIGLHPDAGAAALMRGIVAALSGEGTEVSSFAQAVDHASRGRQMETLWRSHLNLATALYRREQRVTEAVRDHAASALQIMADSLPAADPDASPRFELLRIPMVHAVRFLLAAGDAAGMEALEKYRGLRPAFRDVKTGDLVEGEPHDGGHPNIRVGSEHYILY